MNRFQNNESQENNKNGQNKNRPGPNCPFSIPQRPLRTTSVPRYPLNNANDIIMPQTSGNFVSRVEKLDTSAMNPAAKPPTFYTKDVYARRSMCGQRRFTKPKNTLSKFCI